MLNHQSFRVNDKSVFFETQKKQKGQKHHAFGVFNWHKYFVALHIPDVTEL